MKRRLEKIEAAIPRDGDAEGRARAAEMTDAELRAIIREGTQPGWRENYKPKTPLEWAFFDLSDEAIAALCRGADDSVSDGS
jgi:hypothetical protein